MNLRAWLLSAVMLSGCGGATAPGTVAVAPRGAAEATPDSSGAPVRLADAEIRIQWAPGLQADGASIRRWVIEGAQAMQAYYGRFPVSRLTVQVDEASGAGVQGGKSFGYPAALIRMSVGAGTTQRQFRGDWMMAHEMVHLAFPSVPDRHLWAHEGLATYVEPLARHQAGQLSARKVWHDLLDGLPKGTAELARAGLDDNGSWGATYWGGAYFWLMADITIRQRTGHRKSLRDALRAIVAAGGTSAQSWPLRDTLRRGDGAVGAAVLEGLYDRLRGAPQSIDLDALWRELGIEMTGAGETRFNDAAPLAAVRRAIASDAPGSAVSYISSTPRCDTRTLCNISCTSCDMVARKAMSPTYQIAYSQRLAAGTR